jgi:predicted DNA-binding protein (UPF0251 family)
MDEDTPPEAPDAAPTERFIVLEGASGAPLSPMLQAAAKARGWLINKAGHALIPRISDPDRSWRRFCAFLHLIVNGALSNDAKLETLIQRADMLAQDQQAREALAAQRRSRVMLLPAEPKPAPATTPKRRSPKPKASEPSKREKTRAEIEAALKFCTEAGFSAAEAAEKTGVKRPSIERRLAEMREAGADMGLYDFGKSRMRSLALKGKKYKKTGD